MGILWDKYEKFQFGRLLLAPPSTFLIFAASGPGLFAVDVRNREDCRRNTSNATITTLFIIMTGNISFSFILSHKFLHKYLK